MSSNGLHEVKQRLEVWERRIAKAERGERAIPMAFPVQLVHLMQWQLDITTTGTEYVDRLCGTYQRLRVRYEALLQQPTQ